MPPYTLGIAARPRCLQELGPEAGSNVACCCWGSPMIARWPVPVEVVVISEVLKFRFFFIVHYAWPISWIKNDLQVSLESPVMDTEKYTFASLLRCPAVQAELEAHQQKMFVFSSETRIFWGVHPLWRQTNWSMLQMNACYHREYWAANAIVII